MSRIHYLRAIHPSSAMGPVASRLIVAEQALARLDLAARMVPSLDWFLYAFVRKEALLSSTSVRMTRSGEDKVGLEFKSFPRSLSQECAEPISRRPCAAS